MESKPSNDQTPTPENDSNPPNNQDTAIATSSSHHYHQHQSYTSRLRSLLQPSSPTSQLARLRHFTWANFTLPMATGGLSLLLSPQSQHPHNFPGLRTIGTVFYVLALSLFACVSLCMAYRFLAFRGTLRASVAHPTEGLFLGTSTLSLASLIAGVARYGVPALEGRWSPSSSSSAAAAADWLVTAYLVLFWLYWAASFLLAVGQYSHLFTSPRLRIQDMTPAWDLPIFSFMLCGTVAAAGVDLPRLRQSPDQALPVVFAGLMAQGLGMLVSMCMYASYVRRMIQYGFPSPASRPGMFIAVGPPSFTSLAVIGLAEGFPVTPAAAGGGYYETFGGGDPETTRQVLRILATVTAVFIWSLSLWFFCVSLVACLAVWRQIRFRLNWYALVFPNVGFTMAILSLGRALDSPGVSWVGSVLTVLLVALWLFVVVCHVRALVRGDVMAEGKDEDVYVDEKDHGHVKVLQGSADDVEKQD